MLQKISLLITEHWHMDGGVAFGVVPKGIWSNLYPANEENNLAIVNRLMLIETSKHLILINAGFGKKQSDKYYRFKYIIKSASLTDCIIQAGYRLDQVTDLIFTHLHDDHCGGATILDSESEKVVPLLKNSNYWISRKQWEWALNPNPREAASYFQENLLPLKDSGKLTLLDVHDQPFEDESIMLRHYNGHTGGQMIPFLNYRGKTVVYISDFIPSSAHIPLPYIASVDIAPLVSLAEKEVFLEEAAEKQYILVFEHDAHTESCMVEKTGKGYQALKKSDFAEYF